MSQQGHTRERKNQLCLGFLVREIDEEIGEREGPVVKKKPSPDEPDGADCRVDAVDGSPGASRNARALVGVGSSYANSCSEADTERAEVLAQTGDAR